MNSEDNIPEPHRRIVHRGNRLLATLAHEYFQIKPQYGEDGFKERVFARMDAFSITNPGDMIQVNGEVRSEKVIEFLGLEGEAIQSDVGWIYIACAHSVASARALQAGDQDLAWGLLCEAHKFLGAVLVTNKSQEIFTQTIADGINRERAIHAAKGRHQLNNEMRERAHEIVRSRASWPSQAQAARTVRDTLKAEYGKKFQLSNPENTIKGWLNLLPKHDREKYFLTLGGKSKKP
jgi:hypothetical protein